MRINGTVAWFNSTKGYGFIKQNNGEKDVFLHITALEDLGVRGIKEGARVEFEIGKNEKGKEYAKNITIIK